MAPLSIGRGIHAAPVTRADVAHVVIVAVGDVVALAVVVALVLLVLRLRNMR